MATFRTRTEGGSWTGGGTQVRTCNPTQQAAINNAMTRIRRVIGTWNLPCIAHVRDSLLDRLNCSLNINCSSGDDCDGLRGYTDSRGSPNVTLCPASTGDTIQGLTATLFHEMVHSVGGTELDAEALENHFFGGSGATAPTDGDFDDFRDDEGEFVIWDESTGNVFEKCVEGGSWDESPTVTRGVRLRVNFVDASPGGGSWI